MAPESKKNRSQQIAEEIYQGIRKGTFPMGSRLPGEIELAGIFQANRNTVREAIRYLAAQGILEAVHGSGTYVKQREDIISNMIADGGFRMKDIQEVSELLEPECAALACHRATDQELADILAAGEAAVVKMRDRSSDWYEAALAFHTKIEEATHNEVLIQLTQVLSHVESFEHEDAPRLMRLDLTASDFEILMFFLRERDADGARHAMATHLRRVQVLVKRELSI